MPATADDGHMLQYAFVGDTLVCRTEKLTDKEILEKAKAIPPYHGGRLERFDRCPICEVWTRNSGKLRRNLDCPAVARSALRGD